MRDSRILVANKSFPTGEHTDFPGMQLKVQVSSFNLEMLSEDDITIYIVQIHTLPKSYVLKHNSLVAPEV